MPPRISRRRFVKGTIRLAVVAPLVQVTPLITPGKPRTRISGADSRTLRAAADIIIPAQRRMPSASAVGALAYIQRLAARDRDLQALLLEGLRAIGAHAQATFRVGFDRLPADRQTDVLAHVEKANTPASFFATLRDLVYEAYYTQPRIQKLIGYDFRSGRRRTARLPPFHEELVERVRQRLPMYRPVS
jgi:hypothetical protein